MHVTVTLVDVKMLLGTILITVANTFLGRAISEPATGPIRSNC